MSVILLLVVSVFGYGSGGITSREIVKDEAPTTTSESAPSGEYRRHNLFANSLEYAPRWKYDMLLMPVVYMETEHSTVKLRCEADGRPAPTITWYKDGNVFTGRQIGSFEKKRQFLRIPDLMSFDRGNYTCIVSNRHGQLQHTFIVDVVVRLLQPPVIVDGPRNQVAKEGDNVTLLCRYYSDFEATVHWVKYNDDVIIEDHSSEFNSSQTFHHQQVVLQSEAVSQLTDPTKLVLYNVGQSDSGKYRCYVTNSFGDVNSSASIVVLPSEASPSSVLTYDDVTSSSMIFYVVPSVFCCACVVVLILIVVLRVHCERTRPLRRHKFPVTYCSASINGQHHLLPLPMDTRWELDPDSIELGEQLGEGAFGQVYKASIILGQTSTTNQRITVALKKLKDTATEAELHSFINEIEMMKSVGRHINVVSFIGCYTQRAPLQVAVEFARHGCLRDFLRRNRPHTVDDDVLDDILEETTNDVELTTDLLISFAFQTAGGMEFLSSRKIIHRDLAARNVLVADDMIVKIADFGLTKTLHSGVNYYRHKSACRVPIKWMSPESLANNVYTVKSDVWSYGVLLWEIFTYGSTPYPSVPVESLSRLLDAGYRMYRPVTASVEIYELMLRCWSYKSPDRPSFKQLSLSLHSMFSSDSSQYLSPRTTLPYGNLLNRDSFVFDIELDGSADSGTGSSYIRPLGLNPGTAMSDVTTHCLTPHYDTPPNSRHVVVPPTECAESSSGGAYVSVPVVPESPCLPPTTNCFSICTSASSSSATNESRRLLGSTSTSTSMD